MTTVLPEVFGLDASLSASGVCTPRGETFTIKTGGATLGDHRLVTIRRALIHYVRQFSPRLVVMERMMPHSRNEVANVALGMVQGVARELFAELAIPVGFVHLRTLKLYATGGGAADKTEMIRAAVDLGAPIGMDDNQADAWWLRAMGLHRLGRPIAPEVGQLTTEGKGFRHAAVFGPWPVRGGREVKGSAWPELGALAAAPGSTSSGQQPHRPR
jgi:Holliday junction resolvasome RuvABC endonuclease subunit